MMADSEQLPGGAGVAQVVYLLPHMSGVQSVCAKPAGTAAAASQLSAVPHHLY